MALELKPLKTFRVTVPESHRTNAANTGDFEAIPDGAESVAKEKAAPVSAQKNPVAASDSERAPRASVGAAATGENAESSQEPESYFNSRDRFSKMESRVALSAFGFIVFVLTAAWFSWDEQYSIVGDADSAYNYGLVGGLMMLVILVYALRKRARSMRRMGDIRYWYYFHFILGVVGPVLIILHTSFDIRSINGGVALFAMLFVVFSGFIGRYIYTRASYGLRTHEQDLESVRKHLADGVLHNKLPAFKQVESAIKAFTDQSLQAPTGVHDVVRTIFTVKTQALWTYHNVNKELTRVMKNMARTERWSMGELKIRLTEERRMIRAHLLAAANIGKFQAFEKLASRWRLLHIPLLYLLLLSGLAHVLAVHMY